MTMIHDNPVSTIGSRPSEALLLIAESLDQSHDGTGARLSAEAIAVVRDVISDIAAAVAVIETAAEQWQAVERAHRAGVNVARILPSSRTRFAPAPNGGDAA